MTVHLPTLYEGCPLSVGHLRTAAQGRLLLMSKNVPLMLLFCENFMAIKNNYFLLLFPFPNPESPQIANKSVILQALLPKGHWTELKLAWIKSWCRWRGYKTSVWQTFTKLWRCLHTRSDVLTLFWMVVVMRGCRPFIFTSLAALVVRIYKVQVKHA